MNRTTPVQPLPCHIKSIAAKRQNMSNPWFKRATLFRSTIDVLRHSGSP
jgi:hypothetical protein